MDVDLTKVTVAVQIERFVDEHFQGFVECALMDACGRPEFIEKGPVVSTLDLRSGSVYPQLGRIAGVVEDKWVDDLGRRLARVSIEKPWFIESVEGTTTFTVLEKQIFTA